MHQDTIVLHPDAAVTIINKAIIEAKTKRGVAHISVPKDVLSLPCSLDVQLRLVCSNTQSLKI
jgi:thiamine pyrophosphate-dependent acetolactate synthase large subunit-like protein